MVFFGDSSLRHAVNEFAAHYNQERNHLVPVRRKALPTQTPWRTPQLLLSRSDLTNEFEFLDSAGVSLATCAGPRVSHFLVSDSLSDALNWESVVPSHVRKAR
jgi:hypothetical protein